MDDVITEPGLYGNIYPSGGGTGFTSPDFVAVSNPPASADSGGGFSSILNSLSGIGSIIITGLQKAGTFGTTAQLNALGYTPGQTYQALYGASPVSMGTVIVVLGGIVVLVLLLGKKHVGA